MTSVEIKENLLFYRKKLNERFGNRKIERLNLETALSLNNVVLTENSHSQTFEPMIGHCYYLIQQIELAIDAGEKEERIHRHYGFLQAWLMLLLQRSLSEMMKDNKYGAEKWTKTPDSL